MGEVKLFGVRFSPYSRKVEWALKFKGIEYEYVEEDLQNKSPLLLKYNPVHKKIPVLLHNDKPIAESQVILQYIDETWNVNPLLPEDPYEKAMARFWAKFVDEKCLPAAWSAFVTQGEEQKKAVESALETLKILDEVIKGKKYFGGDDIGFLDFVAGPIAHWVSVFEEVAGIELLTAEKFASLHAWCQNVTTVPAIKENMPPRAQMVPVYATIRKNLLTASLNK